MNKKLKAIEKILKEADLLGLIKVGAPKDEYNNEALMIFEQVNRLDSVNSIQGKLWEIFYKAFCIGAKYIPKKNGKVKKKTVEIYTRKQAHKFIGAKSKYRSAALEIKKVVGK